MHKHQTVDVRALRADDLELDHLLRGAREEGEQVREMCVRAGVGGRLSPELFNDSPRSA